MPVDLLPKLKRKPVIAGIRLGADLERALAEGVEVFFALAGTIFDLEETASRICAARRLVFAHIDLIEGVGRDGAGLRYLARNFGIHGILSTRSALVRAAREEGLLAIQRLFLLDSEALNTGIQVVERSEPDAVEVLPGLIIPSMIHRLPVEKLPPIIAGGLVETEPELRAILATRVVAVSTSKEALWSFTP
ncbi:MAG: glycerol-3-phosphate responsive antiterminator [Bacillota bacterium]|nr:glycerol-3-phosphate responsive antiterminator [Bacillota bacterium]